MALRYVSAAFLLSTGVLLHAQGTISTVAGNGSIGYSGDGGKATSARLSFQGPHGGLALDSAGNLYIADYFDSRIRKVDAKPE